MLRFTTTALIVFLSIAGNFVSAAHPEAVYGDKGMVVSRSALASEAGLEMIERGGNAVDAAVATAFALAVTYPSAGNIGGGGFAVIRLPDGAVRTLDHRETAPAAATRDMFLDEDGEVIKGLSRNSLLASGVPGTVDGLLLLLEEYGSLSRQTVLAPAIRLAQKGFVVNVYLASHIGFFGKALQENPAASEKYSVDGRPIQAGDRWRQPDLARVLKRISSKGRAGFYEGKTAELIVTEMEKGGGIISHEDLRSYQSVWRDPVHGQYRGYDIWGMGLPSSGGMLIIQMLNMLEDYDVAGMGWGNAELIHLMIEAERRAYADRSRHLGDPDFTDIPINELMSKAYARHRMENFDPVAASDSNDIYPGNVSPEESPETAHISVMDDTGMMVSLTTTLNSPYGSKIVVPGTGILLNNEMDDFAIKRNTENQFQLTGEEANQVEPNKRMLSSMSPTIVTRDGGPFLVTGSPGGSTIITTTLQVLLNVIDHQMSLEDAVGLPRFHHQWKPDRIVYEPYVFSPDTLRELKRRGHQNFVQYRFFRGIGDANSILYKDGKMHGVEDPRTDGGAAGM